MQLAPDPAGSPLPDAAGHLTGRQRAAISFYVERLQRHLDLAHWRVEVSEEPPADRAAHLSIEPVDGRRLALLRVAPDWWAKRSAAEKRTDVTHELLHLTHHDAEEALRRFLRDSDEISAATYRRVHDQFVIDMERTVDSLSYVLGAHMPPWPEDR